MMNAIYRRVITLLNNIRNIFRILHLKCKYEGLSVDFKSKIGKNCDIRCVKGSKISLFNSIISDGCQIIADHNSSFIIKNSYIGRYSVLVAATSIIIEDHCQIAEMVTIRDQNHEYGEENKTILEQGFNAAQIKIGKNCWIGAKATILKGVSIEENVVIAAHSIVNKDCSRNSLYGGIPNKKIKSW